ncbi:MAG: alanine--tRNA ligase [Clostridia bacterium]|nr:alanine--tRNA ligase [Clostridia bacterium]
MISSKELRKKWLDFYISKGHTDIGAVSLIGDGTTGVMFNVAGMQPLMPYLLGAKHPSGSTRLCNIQGCVRTVDIESVGDASHLTFFEMMGNWSLGDYFKKEKTAWTFELLTKEFGLDSTKILATVFEGDESAPRDEETAGYLKELGIKAENIFYLSKDGNWWELEGTTGTPCGPDNEWYYPRHDHSCGENCGPECDCGRYVEIGNDVYMQYEKTEDGYKPLENKNVDTGFGFERMLLFLNNVNDVYQTDLFTPTISLLEKVGGLKYGEDEKTTRAMRIIADHTRTAIMLIGDVNGIVPSNVGAGYILRRIMRRAIRFCRQLNLDCSVLNDIASIYIDEIYNEAYPLLVEKKQYILDEITKEVQKFEKMLIQGNKEFEKVIDGINRKREFMLKNDPNAVVENIINGKSAFRLYDTFGFPIELTIEMAEERGFTVDKDGFDEAFREHQEKSKTAEKGEFKGGLSEGGEMETRYHTAVHLMQAGLRKVLGDTVFQRGQNITSERARFDFSYDKPMTKEEIEAVENYVNDVVQKEVDVTMEEMSVEEAKNSGAIGIFDSKYGDVVKVYSVGDYSKEICGGPHVKNTREIGKFKIVKEQSSSAGVRRIRAEIQ